MIRIETVGYKDKFCVADGEIEVLCVETLLLIATLIKSDVIRQRDKDIIKKLLILDNEGITDVIQQLQDTLNEM